MADITELRHQYASRCINIAGEEVLRVLDAISFVQDCQRFSITIVGMEFFEQKGSGIMPTGIADYSELSRLPDAVNLSAEAAIGFLSQISDDKSRLVAFTLREVDE